MDPAFDMVVYYFLPKSGNFGWIVNGKSNFVSPNGNFIGKTGFLERWTKILTRNARMEDSCSIC